VLLSFSAVTVSSAQDLPADYTWTGLGATDHWSDPANWAENRAPTSPQEVLAFAPTATGRATSRQDVADPFLVGTGIRLNSGSSVFEITGNPIQLLGGGFIADETLRSGARVISAPLRLDGATEVRTLRGGSFENPGLTLMDVSGPGSISVTGGRVQLAHASYTGTTTVTNGEVQVGGWVRGIGLPSPFVVGATEGQGDYLIRPDSVTGTARLTGTGTIGLAPGRKITVENGGIIDSAHDALGPVATKLAINGNLRIGDLGRGFSFSPGPGDADVIDVNGVLDLTGIGDSLELGAFFIGTGTIVVAEYDTRLGEFDRFNYSLMDPSFPPGPVRTATLSYTSAAGAGPGQVIVTVVPEPATSAAVILLAFRLLKRRRASSPVYS
jgi:hypothetical protein